MYYLNQRDLYFYFFFVFSFQQPNICEEITLDIIDLFFFFSSWLLGHSLGPSSAKYLRRGLSLSTCSSLSRVNEN